MIDKDYYRSKRDGLYYYRIVPPKSAQSAAPRRGPRPRGVCTGEVDLTLARAMVEHAGLEKLNLLTQAGVMVNEAVGIINRHKARSCEDIMAWWKKWLAVVGAPKTVLTYGCEITALFNYLKSWQRPFISLTETELDRWVNAGAVKRNTCEGRLKALRSLYSYAVNKGIVSENPAQLVTVRVRDMTLAQLEPKETFPFTDSEYAMLLMRLAGFWRDWVILGYCAGYRLGDCAALEYDSMQTDSIVIYPKKTGKRLVLSLADPLVVRPELQELMTRLFAERRRNAIRPYAAHYQKYFIDEQRHRYSGEFGAVLRKLGIENRSFHSLRRAFAVRLRVAGVELEGVRVRMGHASVETTKIYTGERRRDNLMRFTA